MDLIYKEEVYAIQGACFEVYRETGCSFLEAVYQPGFPSTHNEECHCGGMTSNAA